MANDGDVKKISANYLKKKDAIKRKNGEKLFL